LIAAEEAASRDMRERGRRLRAAKAIVEAVVISGETLKPLGEGFAWARKVGTSMRES
jgi:hypothetical protein